MNLSSLVLSAVGIVFGSMFLVVGISYVFYKVRNNSNYNMYGKLEF